MFKSALVKLTLWYALLACILCIMFSAIVYRLSTEELSEALNNQYHSLVNNDHDNDNVPLPVDTIRHHSEHLLMELIWLNGVVIVGSCVVGSFLARRTLKPIEQAHQAQIRFTAEASHELRTPLAAMRADTEVALMEKGLSSQARHTLQDNLQDIERLEVLSSNLLDLARYQNAQTIKPSVVDLDEHIQRAVKQLAYMAKKRHVTITSKIQPIQIMGDKRTIEQLVTIVLENAIKYSKENGTILITTSKDAAKATLSVQDHGIGIPANDLPHVFEYFYRSGNTRTTGYGLGLPLAQEITKAHKGKIEIQSREHYGTTVTITLPLA